MDTHDMTLGQKKNFDKSIIPKNDCATKKRKEHE